LCTSYKVDLAIMGDLNLQPASLGGGPDPKPGRDRAWTTLLKALGLCELNPPIGGDAPQDIYFPVRDITLTNVCPGHTRHSGGAPRSIDLAACSSESTATYAIHNSLHCLSAGHCPWGHCHEFCLSDHFLQSLELTQSQQMHADTAAPSFPRHWHSADRWAAAFHHIEGALKGLHAVTLFWLDVHWGPLSLSPRLLRSVQTWILNILSWVHCVLGNLARECWVHPCCSTAPGTISSVHVTAPGLTSPAPAAPCSSCAFPSAPVALAHRLHAELSRRHPTSVTLQKCFRWLRPSRPKPPTFMKDQGLLLSSAGTHRAWCSAITNQHSSGAKFPGNIFMQQRHKVVSAWGQSLRAPKGPFDSDLTQPQVLFEVSAWKPSKAVPADLLPRTAYTCGSHWWDLCVWSLQRIACSGHWAIRPARWRWTMLVAHHKKGPLIDIESWRLLSVRVQMGLLQEAIVATRIRPTIISFLLAGQSGYIRGTEDPQLVLHEVITAALHADRCVWLLMGDFRKAFPRTSRVDLLSLLLDGPRIRDHCFLLLKDILEVDFALVTLGGYSAVAVRDGLPEGGVLGPLLYLLLPDSLGRFLLQAGCGISRSPLLPTEWANHAWSGDGCPHPPLVEVVKDSLRGAFPVPPASLLAAWPALEASASRALDILDPDRLCFLFHADDPVLFASSAGELQRTTTLISVWAARHNAEFHSTDCKSVVFRFGGHGTPAQIVLPTAHDSPGVPLSLAYEKKWLGLMWDSDRGAAATLKLRVRQASGAFAPLCGFACTGTIPLSFLLVLFEAKVDGILAHSRWFFACAPDAASTLDSLFTSWARGLLGAPKWHHGTVARWELGWALSGAARAVLSAACRRAKLWLLHDGDFYKHVFLLAHTWPGETWAKLSRSLLQDWGIADITAGTAQPSYNEYKHYVRDMLASKCCELSHTLRVKHTNPVPYTSIAPAVPNTHKLVLDAASRLPWSCLQGIRSWCRFRAGLVPLAHINRRRSQASIQHCVLCDTRVRNPSIHAIFRCTAVSDLRPAAAAPPAEGFQEALCRLLQTPPESRDFAALVQFIAAIDKLALDFWHSSL